MGSISDKDLIESIDWDKEFDDLSPDEQVNYLILRGFPILNKENREFVKYHYLKDQLIVEERGKDNLLLYM